MQYQRSFPCFPLSSRCFRHGGFVRTKGNRRVGSRAAHKFDDAFARKLAFLCPPSSPARWTQEWLALCWRTKQGCGLRTLLCAHRLLPVYNRSPRLTCPSSLPLLSQLSFPQKPSFVTLLPLHPEEQFSKPHAYITHSAQHRHNPLTEPVPGAPPLERKSLKGRPLFRCISTAPSQTSPS